MRTETPIHVPITSTGYVGVAKDKGEDQFLIRFIPFTGESLVLGRVASTCTPHENFLNQKALIIESCGPKSADIFLDAWTTDGKKLWTGHRDGHLVWPTFAYSRTGDRFAVSLLHVTHFIDLVDSLNDEDVREQVVQVFDSATGALLDGDQRVAHPDRRPELRALGGWRAPGRPARGRDRDLQGAFSGGSRKNRYSGRREEEVISQLGELAALWVRAFTRACKRAL